MAGGSKQLLESAGYVLGHMGCYLHAPLLLDLTVRRLLCVGAHLSQSAMLPTKQVLPGCVCHCMLPV